MITSLTSHFTHADDMASSSREPQKTTTTKDKPRPRTIAKVKKADGTKAGQGKWSGYERRQNHDVMTGEEEEALKGQTGKIHQRMYYERQVKGTDVGQRRYADEETERRRR